MKRIAKLMITVLFLGVFLATDIKIFAEEGTVIEDDEFGTVVFEKITGFESIDEYVECLNNGTVEASNTRIITYEPKVKRDGLLEDPTKSCSNIFGHKWSDWDGWVVTRTFENGGHLMAVMERWRYCERTFCGAKQRELDFVQID